MRKVVLIALVLFSGVLFATRLFYLQVYDASPDSLSENSAIKVVYDYPQRGCGRRKCRSAWQRHGGSLQPKDDPIHDGIAISSADRRMPARRDPTFGTGTWHTGSGQQIAAIRKLLRHGLHGSDLADHRQ